jgi:hypothetical protein
MSFILLLDIKKLFLSHILNNKKNDYRQMLRRGMVVRNKAKR